MNKHTATPKAGKCKAVSATELVSITNMLHKQLECLKYIGGKTTAEKPTGEGVDINILLLPCLALDFRQYNIGKGKRVCTVGGRAARMACALLHLQDQEDGTYRIQLLARTGELGRILLANEFTAENAVRHQRNLNLDLVFTRPGEPRCVIFKNKGAHPDSPGPLKENELRLEDLKDPRVGRAISRAKAICFTSIKLDQHLDLIEELANYLKPQETPIFLDLLRSGPNSLVVKLFTKIKAIKGVPPLHLFVPSDITNKLCRLAKTKTIHEMCHAYNIRVITYSNNSSTLTVTGPKGIEHYASGIKPIKGEDMGIRFKAGVVLAESLYQAIITLDIKNELGSKMLAFWKDAHWEKVIGYGAAMASAITFEADKHEGYCSLEQLVCRAGNKSEHYPDNTTVSLVRNGMFPEFPAPKHSTEFVLHPEHMGDAAQLAGFRRGSADASRTAPSLLYNPKLSLCAKPNPKCDFCPKRNVEPSTPSAAVMIDLDSTLMNSTAERRKAVSVALRRLVSSLEKIGYNVAINYNSEGKEEPLGEFFDKNIYSLWSVFKLMGRGDFRQQWNHHGWYASFIILAHEPGLLEDLVNGSKHFVALCEENPWEQARDNYGQQNIESLQKTIWWQMFANKYDEVLKLYGDLIKTAQANFEGVELTPYKEARDFLKSLKDSGAFYLYVVSEGDPATQWLKLKSTGLADFIGRDHLLTTGEAAEPVKERQQLSDEQNAISKQYTEAVRRQQSADQRVFDSGGLHRVLVARLRNNEASARIASELSRRSQADEMELPSLEAATRRLELYQQAILFANAVITRMAKKRGKPFYAAVVRAILRKPHSPLNELRNFSRLMDKPRNQEMIKFAMIGDRQDNDIDPPSELLGREHLLSIRIRSERDSKQTKNKEFPPNYIVESLAQAKAIILSKNTWDHIWCKDAPPIFNWRNMPEPGGNSRSYFDSSDNTVCLAVLIAGIIYASRPSSLTRKICAGVLLEQFASQSDKWQNDGDADKALSTCLQPPFDDHDDFERVVLVERVLCALVLSAQVCSDPLLRRLADRIAVKISELYGELKRMPLSTEPIAFERTTAFLEMGAALRTFADNGSDFAKNIARNALED